ncbi:MAG TPA: hypothetical protein VIM60_06160, partial [Edaphobacter sp.]
MPSVYRSACLFSLLLAAVSSPAIAQRSSSSSSSNPTSPEATMDTQQGLPARPRVVQPSATGSAVTLETSESLFDLATALNACGYDADLDASAPVRRQVRDEVNAALASASAEARDHRDALCKYIREHQQMDPGQNIAQYISLSLYVEPPPRLTPSVGETELPPDSTQVVNILPLLRTFAEDVNLHGIWVTHRAEYEALVNDVHQPLTKAVLDTNIYLKLPVSSYDGRRFMV